MTTMATAVTQPGWGPSSRKVVLTWMKNHA